MIGKAGESLRVATYNVHGCYGMDGRRSEARIADVIAALNADVVGLQELDLNRLRSTGVDQAALIAEYLGWHHYFHAAMRKGDEHYGDAILSRYSMRLRQASALPSVMTRICPETRAAIWMELETPGGRLQVINTHLGLGRRERLMQAELLAGPEWLGRVGSDDPLILLGDFNSLPGSRPYQILTQRLRDVRSIITPWPRLRTFPTRYPLLAVDHVFVNDRVRVSSAVVARNAQARIASDHFPLVVEVSLA